MPFATHTACTVELANIDRTFDVAVIDEIQMIADPQRGELTSSPSPIVQLNSIQHWFYPDSCFYACHAM